LEGGRPLPFQKKKGWANKKKEDKKGIQQDSVWRYGSKETAFWKADLQNKSRGGGTMSCRREMDSEQDRGKRGQDESGSGPSGTERGKRRALLQGEKRWRRRLVDRGSRNQAFCLSRKKDNDQKKFPLGGKGRNLKKRGGNKVWKRSLTGNVLSHSLAVRGEKGENHYCDWENMGLKQMLGSF